MHWGVLEPKVAVRSVELLLESVASVQTQNNFQNSTVDLQSVMLCKVRGRYNAFSHHHSFHASSVTAACLDLSLQNHSHCFLRLLFPSSKRKHISETTRTLKEKENHSLFRKASSRAHTDCPEPWQVLGKL